MTHFSWLLIGSSYVVYHYLTLRYVHVFTTVDRSLKAIFSHSRCDATCDADVTFDP